jgi:hypothetical protein
MADPKERVAMFDCTRALIDLARGHSIALKGEPDAPFCLLALSNALASMIVAQPYGSQERALAAAVVLDIVRAAFEMTPSAREANNRMGIAEILKQDPDADGHSVSARIAAAQAADALRAIQANRLRPG